MFNKLVYKFILIYLITATASFLLISVGGSSLINSYLISNESKSMYETAKLVSDNFDDISELQEIQDQLFTFNIIAKENTIDILILSPSGEVYFDSDEENVGKNLVIENFDPSDFNSGYYIIGNFFGSYETETLSVISPIISGMSIRGYAAVIKPMSIVYSQRESILKIMHLIEILILVFSLSIIIFLQLWVLNPIKKITDNVRLLANGTLNNKIEIKQNDEIGYLARTLNYLGGELSKSNEYQSKFISNVSHDFRSPLTSIKGYVEAIKDGIIPYEMKDKYLDRVISETDRLNKLTQELLSLDNIEKRVHQMNFTQFNINELIRDTALSFELICVNRNITLNLSLEGDILSVTADYGKIQQVMYNLIDNAIKFSNDNSEIDIETGYKNKKVYISVKDHGIGIANRDLPKIWERFYKADESRGRDRTGTGLGLSIVREAVQAHDQNINVVSTLGVGTEFSFTLDATDSE